MERTPLSRRLHNMRTPLKRRDACNIASKTGTPAGTSSVTKSGNKKKNVKYSATATPHTEDDSQKICVSVRVRPPPTSVDNVPSPFCVFKSSENEIRVRTNQQSKDCKENYLVFTYDHVFWFDDKDKGASQSTVFDKIAIPLLDSSIEGYNVCLFAYGQTGSGKTYSLMDADGHFTDEGMGVIPRFCKELIRRREIQQDFDLDVSYYEIYHEKIYDLLCKDGPTDNRASLKVREHPLSGPYVAELTSIRVYSFPELAALILLGNGRRITGATLHNERSSRSHTIFDISLHRPTHEQTKVRLVDLAGSERVSQCAVTEERFREGLSINKSLLTLGKVITALAERRKRAYVPYRESVLTWLLRDSLGGRSRTCMLATVSPALGALDETLSTLRWAHKARSIVCIPTKNEDPQIRLIVDLQNEVKRLRALRSDMSGGAETIRDSLSELQQLQVKLDLEKQQKSAEIRLQTELAKLEQTLNEAEKRKCELESQRETILQEASENSIPSYKSSFYDNLKNILELSINESIGDIMKEDVSAKIKSTAQLKSKYLYKMKDMTECLQSIYCAEASTHPETSNSKIALLLMNEIQERLNCIMDLS